MGISFSLVFGPEVWDTKLEIVNSQVNLMLANR